MDDAPRDVLVLYNKATKESKEVPLDFGFCNDPEDLLIRFGGDEYKLVSTKSPEQLRLEKQITTFGTQEFPKLAKRFPEFGTSSTHMKFSSEISDALRERLDRPGYKTIRRAIVKDQQIFTRICHAFAQYISATRAVEALQKELKERRLDEVYMLDYLKRYKKIMDLLVDKDHPPLRKQISDLFAEINKDIDMDARRPIGSSKVLELLSPFMSALQICKDDLNKVPMEDPFYAPGDEDEDRSAMWEAIHQASLATQTNLETYQVECEKRTQAFAEMKEDKLHYHTNKILELHKGLLKMHRDTFQHTKDDPSSIGEMQQKFVTYLKNYVADVSNWGCDFVCDRRPLSVFFTKMLELQYDTVFYYLEQRTKDEQWILHLVQAISEHIPYLEKALSGELQEPSAQA